MKDRIFFIVLAIVIFLTACEENDELKEREYPVLVANVEKIDNSGVILAGEFKTPGSSPINEFGFIWGQTPTTLNNKHIIKNYSNKFYFSINNNIPKGDVFYAQAYALTNKYESRSNTLKFTSKGFISGPPFIDSIAPKIAAVGYELNIAGNNFPNKKSDVKVFIKNTACDIINYTSTSVLIRIPAIEAGKWDLKLKLYEKIYNIGEITIAKPKIFDFFPKTGFENTLITVKGKYMGTRTGVKIGNHPNYHYFVASDSLLTFQLPETSQKGNVALSIKNYTNTTTPKDSFFIKSHYIKEIKPKQGSIGDIVTINGGFFIQGERTSKVYFNDIQAHIVDMTSENISVLVPDYPLEDTTTIKVVNGSIKVENKDFQLHSQWEKLANFPGNERAYATSVFINGNAYLGLGASFEGYFDISTKFNDWWKYDPKNQVWSKLSNFPGDPRYNCISFIINDKAYIGFGDGNYDLWEYSPSNDSWMQKNIPDSLIGYKSLHANSYKNIGYILLEDSDNNPYIFTYNPNSNEWINLKTPSELYNTSYQNPFFLKINEVLYLMNIDYYNSFTTVYKYDDINCNWDYFYGESIKFRHNKNRYNTFTINNKGYFSDVYYWVFDPSQLSIKKIKGLDFWEFPVGQSSFVYEDYAIISFGKCSGTTDCGKYIWKFSPEIYSK